MPSDENSDLDAEDTDSEGTHAYVKRNVESKALKKLREEVRCLVNPHVQSDACS